MFVLFDNLSLALQILDNLCKLYENYIDRLFFCSLLVRNVA